MVHIKLWSFPASFLEENTRTKRLNYIYLYHLSVRVIFLQYWTRTMKFLNLILFSWRAISFFLFITTSNFFLFKKRILFCCLVDVLGLPGNHYTTTNENLIFVYKWALAIFSSEVCVRYLLINQASNFLWSGSTQTFLVHLNISHLILNSKMDSLLTKLWLIHMRRE